MSSPAPDPAPRFTARAEAAPFYTEVAAPQISAPVVTFPEAAETRRAARLVAALLGVAMLLAVAGLLYWRFVPEAPAVPSLPEPPVVSGSETIESALPRLHAQADAWLPGATPTNVTMQVDWPASVEPGRGDQIPAGGWITAVFLAPWDAPFGRSAEAAVLTLLMDRSSGQIVQQSTFPWETGAPPASREPSTAPAVTSTDAMRAAESAAGREFREACPEVRHISRARLIDTGNEPRHWLVNYQDNRTRDRLGLAVRIDAATGDVMSSEEDARPCPTG